MRSLALPELSVTRKCMTIDLRVSGYVRQVGQRRQYRYVDDIKELETTL